MDLNNVKRNDLDYILTDVLPVELSDLFTYSYFYKFLMQEKKVVEEMVKKIIRAKNNSSSNNVLFKGSKNWATIPLKYTVMKSFKSEREISILQPMAAVETFLFISAYQKEILNILEKGGVYSLRYHHRNNNLCYKNKNKAVIQYFQEESKNAKKDIIEQTGMYFDIKPYKSIASFTSSEEWFVLNSKYRYFVRTDYKACFDSIYTHTYKWLLGKDVNDTKEFKNVNIFTIIDRVMQNINARTSNGIVVGPEFSRMIAEILLQGIDVKVHNTLLNLGKEEGKDYNIYRYVDDIFIFTESEKLADKIIDIYAENARKYLLHLNEAKLSKKQVPFVLDSWLNDTNIYVSRVSNGIFTSKEEQRKIIDKYKEEEIVSNKAYIFKDSMFFLMKASLMKQFNKLICDFKDKSKTVVAYCLGMILNKVQRNKLNLTIFKDNVSVNTIFEFLDFILYIYSYYPDYNNTQRLLSIISYIRDEVDLFKQKEQLQRLINKYAFIFGKANLNDLINLVLFCRQAKVEIPYKQECRIIDELRVKDDPILWASYMIYAQYSHKYSNSIKEEVCQIIKERMESIICKESIYTYREFWWLLIFNKSPLISQTIQGTFDTIIDSLEVSNSTDRKVGEICGDLFVSFLKNSNTQFFEWDIEQRDFLRDITFKTYERSIFKNYKENLNFMNWSSI